MSLYSRIEKTFFHTLTRKIASNMGFLMLLMLGVLGLNYSTYRALGAVVVETPAQRELAALISQHLLVTSLLLGLALVGALALIFFMRHLFLRPIRAMTGVLSAISEKEGDISGNLPEFTHDEISAMAMAYNRFAGNLRSIIAHIRRSSVRVALGSTQLSKVIQHAHERVSQQEEYASLVFQSSSEATEAISNIAEHTSAIADRNGENLAGARTSADELDRMVARVREVDALVADFAQTVDQLQDNSTQIGQILTMVAEFSEQTNLLALNAAIEAARAGDHGRGFAVVADEVRTLSRKVSEAASQIGQNVSVMTQLVESTRLGTEKIKEHTGSTQAVIVETSSRFQQMVVDFDQVNGQLTDISAAIEELSITNQQSHQHVSRITALSGEVKADIDFTRNHSESLEASTEEIQELLSRFIIGQGSFERIMQTARGWRDQVEAVLQRLADEGHDLFDHNYQPVPDSNPQKYRVAYNDAFERAVQPLVDSFVAARPEFIYAIPVCTTGYLPTHHSHLSRPLTGDPEADNLVSRHQRIYNSNRAEVRRAENTQPFLLQTYLRDTGEVLNNLSLPIYINGRHWGGFILGFASERLLDD